VVGRGGTEALAEWDKDDGAAAKWEEEGVTTGPHVLLTDIILCAGGDSGVMTIFWHGQGVNGGWWGGPNF
jgi:hypothetical protein